MLAFAAPVGARAVQPVASAAAAASGSQSGGVCIGRHPNPSAVWYTGACSGHDEPAGPGVVAAGISPGPDLDGRLAGRRDGAGLLGRPNVLGGGALSNPNPHALFGQAFLELQFYPDSVVKTCSSDGGYNVTYAPDEFTVCSPVWQVSTQSGAEDAAFNAELYDGSTHSLLIMHAGDTIKIHFFDTTPTAGWNISVNDLTTGHSGSIVLASKYGPLLPLFSAQQIGDALGWGLVNDTPNSFVWEIGHTSNFTTPAGQLCVAGQTDCASYDTAHWLGFTPLKILSVKFANGSAASQWAVGSDLGGKAEVAATCPTYGGPYCAYPWYASNSAAKAITYGADYPGTKFAYGQGSQFATTPLCGGPFGVDAATATRSLHRPLEATCRAALRCS